MRAYKHAEQNQVLCLTMTRGCASVPGHVAAGSEYTWEQRHSAMCPLYSVQSCHTVFVIQLHRPFPEQRTGPIPHVPV